MNDLGLPPTHDGGVEVTTVIWVPKLSSLSEAQWEYLGTTFEMDWVIIGMESEDHGHRETGTGKRENRVKQEAQVRHVQKGKHRAGRKSRKREG